MEWIAQWGIVALVLLAIALCWPVVKKLGGFILRTAGGLVALFLFGPIGNFIGVTLGVNLFNGLVLGLLGVPGFGLLLLLHWVVP